MVSTAKILSGVQSAACNYSDVNGRNKKLLTKGNILTDTDDDCLDL